MPKMPCPVCGSTNIIVTCRNFDWPHSGDTCMRDGKGCVRENRKCNRGHTWQQWSCEDEY